MKGDATSEKKQFKTGTKCFQKVNGQQLLLSVHSPKNQEPCCELIKYMCGIIHKTEIPLPDAERGLEGT